MTVPGILDTSGMIMKTRQFEWSFGCKFESSYDIEADEMAMDSSTRSGEFFDTGRFDLSIYFYASDAFEVISDGSNEIGGAVNYGSKHFK